MTKARSFSVHIPKESQTGHPITLARVLMVNQKHISLSLT